MVGPGFFPNPCKKRSAPTGLEVGLGDRRFHFLSGHHLFILRGFGSEVTHRWVVGYISEGFKHISVHED